MTVPAKPDRAESAKDALRHDPDRVLRHDPASRAPGEVRGGQGGVERFDVRIV